LCKASYIEDQTILLWRHRHTAECCACSLRSHKSTTVCSHTGWPMSDVLRCDTEKLPSSD